MIEPPDLEAERPRPSARMNREQRRAHRNDGCTWKTDGDGNWHCEVCLEPRP